MMQFNMFFVELLGEDALDGISIPVVIDDRDELGDGAMESIARELNNYKTVFVKKSSNNRLKTRIFSSFGESFDCLYASVAAIFILTESSYIRGVETGDKDLIIETECCKNKVSVSYKENRVISINHEVDIPKIRILKEHFYEKFELKLVECLDDLDTNIFIIFTKDAVTFSKLRRKKISLENIDKDLILIYYDEEDGMILFSTERNRIAGFKHIDSRELIGIVISYLLYHGINKEDINTICHVFQTGKFANLSVEIKEDDKINIRMNARTLVQGILNI